MEKRIVESRVGEVAWEGYRPAAGKKPSLDHYDARRW